MREPTPESFLQDIEHHEMKILHESGLYRHLRFKESKSSNMWFDLVTWPGIMTIHGDMGTWTFSRLEDMFTFFRSGSDLKINPSYWAEKLQHGNFSGREGGKVWDEESFKEDLGEQVASYGLEQADLDIVSRAIREDVFRQDNKYELMIYARDFVCEISDGSEFQFDPCDLPDGMIYSYHFIWCLYAIVWGIQRWDARLEVAA